MILGGTDLYDADFSKQYWYSFYNSVFLLVGVETAPFTSRDGQTVFASVVIILGALFQAYLFGEMAVLTEAMTAKATKFAAMQDSANTTMKNLHLCMELQYAISDYLVQTARQLDA